MEGDEIMFMRIKNKGIVDFGEQPSEYHIPNETTLEWEYSEELHWRKIRNRRDVLLSSTDWAVLPDSPYNTQALLDYRQALRDLPQTFTNPDDVVWPDNPLGG